MRGPHRVEGKQHDEQAHQSEAERRKESTLQTAKAAQKSGKGERSHAGVFSATLSLQADEESDGQGQRPGAASFAGKATAKQELADRRSTASICDSRAY